MKYVQKQHKNLLVQTAASKIAQKVDNFKDKLGFNLKILALEANSRSKSCNISLEKETRPNYEAKMATSSVQF